MTEPHTEAENLGVGTAEVGNARARRFRELNATIRYTMWSVFAAPAMLSTEVESVEPSRNEQLAELAQLWRDLAEVGVVIRGCYDLAGLRADADLMVWWHAESIELLQHAYSRLRATQVGRQLRPVWSQAALHRPAEFNKSHMPAFLADEIARNYVCVYPFVRSYEWYLLPDEQRRAMLAEHGAMARDYPDVRANTVASFGLGDYEWMLAFEADELHRIVDLMRELRASTARRHVRVEVPFYTGRRRSIGEIVASWA
jgi:chlorite dismutase